MVRLQHDAAVAIAQACLDAVASCVHPSCHKDAWQEFYQIARAGLESYEQMARRQEQRLRPSRN
jgi:hypothetical protein